MFNSFRALLMRGVCSIAAFILLCSLALIQAPGDSVYASGLSEHALYNELKSGKPIWKDKNYVPAEQPTVYLTFDDGPSPLTGKVLDILKEENVKATFFVLGGEVKSHPELVRRALEEGHAIGNHTYNHVYKELYSGAEAFWNQIQKTEDILEEQAGIRPTLVRAPGGTYSNFDAFYFYYMDQAGYEVYDWNIDSGDSARPGVPANEIIQTVRKGPFKQEVILLMHDGTGHEQTVKALPDIIKLFKDKGYSFEALSPQVPPIHFPVGKLKWTRGITEATHQKLLAQAEDHLLAVEREKGQEGVQQGGGDNQALKNAPVIQVPLDITLGERTLHLNPEQYRLSEGQYQVPLRLLVESMDGQIEWQERDRTAVVRYGMYAAEYDFSRQEQRVKEGGKETAYHVARMELREGTVYVPLRDTLEMLGNQIISYGEEDGLRQVNAKLNGGIMLKLGF
ncbi:polysaccharide deacetylase [Paenibacillus sp. UNC451MF]|uniref:polysaccharide deacetylase n=1 Tax=Paenibacillus sp. UNC451MF TaxID=1449063 RepID=UPI00068E298E|nr:polysaccharide deacetylase [Paenibacillus sp. UNC451MF]